MLTDEMVPREPERLAKVFVQLPALADDSPRSCPVAPDQLAAEVAEELGLDALDPDALAFARTAELDEVRSWVWRLEGAGDRPVWVVVTDDEEATTLGCIVDEWGLTAEQAIIGDHFGVV